MNKFLSIIFLILLSFANLSAQQINNNVSIRAENKSLKEIFREIEAQTDYNFFFSEDWVVNINYTGSLNNLSVDDALSEILNETVLNHFLLGNRIILTQNALIYDELPSGFFGKAMDTIEESTGTYINIQPINIFRASNDNNKTETKTYKIGKEDYSSNEKEFVLKGRITEVKTGNPIPDLSLLLKKSGRVSVTDENGFYQIILNKGENVLETKSLGIENRKLRILMFNNGSLDIRLNEDFEQLDEVVLQAEHNSNVEKTLSGSTRINVEETKKVPLVLGERDVLKVATSLPGISTAGEGALGFNVRGGKTDQNLILFDNAVLYNTQHFFGIFSALNPFMLGDVQIFKGGIPAEYGGRLSSVIDLSTKKSNKNKLAGEGSIGPVTGNLSIEIPVVKDKSSLNVGGRGAYANWILRSLDEESLNKSQASFYDLTATYEHNFNEKNQVKLTAYASRDDFSITSDSLNIYKNSLVALNWNHQFNEKSSLGTTVSNSQYGFDINFDGNSSDSFTLGYKVAETEFKTKFSKVLKPNLSYNVGLSSKLYRIDPGSFMPSGEESLVVPLEIERERGLESAIFVSANFEPVKKLSLDAGIRFSLFNALGPGTQFVYEENSPKNESTIINTLNFENNEIVKTYGGPEWRLSSRYLIKQDLSLKASFNSTIQYIHQLTNNTTVSPIDTWKLSDLNIEPQRANQFAFGVFKNWLGSNYETSVEAFYKNSDNILDFKTGAQLLLNENIEREVLQGGGKAYGIELLIKKNKGKINGWLGYTYSRSFLKLDSEFNEERVNNGAFFPSNFDKPHDFSFVGNYQFTRRFSVSANIVYQTGRPVTFPVGNFQFNNSPFVVFSDRNEFRIPDFYRLDLGFNVEGNHKKNKLAHSFWTFSIYNVLGRNNPFSVFFITEEGDIKALQSSIFSIPVPSITYNFKF
ncbi:carboxypeptidase-like regulatory domain-containing protein [Maribacter sp. 2210JD10-5]|uniref:TonB-dependent receptor n=1 Tax=Maribacter sp. 2210JD10-5 TaxID=3386272 RepID=UPI0039BC39E6